MLIEFELKKEHIDLITNLDWCFDPYNKENKDIKLPIINSEYPFGEINKDLYRICTIILYGFKLDIQNDEVHDYEFNEERKNNIDKLLSELDIAMNIIMNNKTFEPGLYFKRHSDYKWKKKGGK